MTVYEQQARAMKEIAAELKGIRRALDIIGKSLKPKESPGLCAMTEEPCVVCCEMQDGDCEHLLKWNIPRLPGMEVADNG